LFPPQALNRVRLIRGALAIGFSVRELTAIFAERDHGGAPCHHVRDLARKKLAAVEVSLRNRQIWRRELKTTLATWDRLLRTTPEGQRAGLLETFVASHPTRQTRYSSLVPLPRGNPEKGEVTMRGLFVAVVFCVAVSCAQGQQPAASQTEKAKDPHADCPMHKAHAQDQSVMNERGTRGMGFSQTATTHHFLLKTDGGAIQVEASDTADTDSRDSIRMRSAYATRLSAGGVADEWVTQMLRQSDAQVFKKHSQMKLQMKREALEKLNRRANEMPPVVADALMAAPMCTDMVQ
jgi:hypothetical protein